MDVYGHLLPIKQEEIVHLMDELMTPHLCFSLHHICTKSKQKTLILGFFRRVFSRNRLLGEDAELRSVNLQPIG